MLVESICHFSGVRSILMLLFYFSWKILFIANNVDPDCVASDMGLHYRISSVIRQSFFFFQNNPKDLDPSCKTDLDLLDCLGRVNLVL